MYTCTCELHVSGNINPTCICTFACICTQGCGNIELTTGHFDLFSPLLSCSPYTLYILQFQFIRHSIDLSDNVLYDWLFPHYCVYTTCISIWKGVTFILCLRCVWGSSSITDWWRGRFFKTCPLNKLWFGKYVHVL